MKGLPAGGAPNEDAKTKAEKEVEIATGHNPTQGQPAPYPIPHDKADQSQSVAPKTPEQAAASTAAGPAKPEILQEDGGKWAPRRQ